MAKRSASSVGESMRVLERLPVDVREELFAQARRLEAEALLLRRAATTLPDWPATKRETSQVAAREASVPTASQRDWANGGRYRKSA